MNWVHLAIATPTVAALALGFLALWWRGAWLGAKGESAQRLAEVRLKENEVATVQKMLLDERAEKVGVQARRLEEANRFEAIIEAQKHEMAEMEIRILRLVSGDGVRPQTTGTTEGGALIVQIDSPAPADSSDV